MKSIIVLVFAIAATVLAQEKYDEGYDNFNIGEVLGNERLLNNYTKCLLDKGPCVPAVAEFKAKIPEILETKCAKCTEKQKSLGKQMAQEIKKSRPELWKQLVAKYDPSGKYTETFQDYFN